MMSAECVGHTHTQSQHNEGNKKGTEISWGCGMAGFVVVPARKSGKGIDLSLALWIQN